MKIHALLTALALAFCHPAAAQEAPTPTEPALASAQSGVESPLIDSVVVSGRVQGPGLWKVSRGEHVMWVLGLVSPIPHNIQWDSIEVEARMSRAQEWLLPPNFAFSPRGGIVGGLFLLPQANRLRRNPDGKTLQQVLSPEDAARWQRLQQRYLADKPEVNQLRPYFAGGELYRAVLRQNGLGRSGVVGETLERLRKQKRLKTVSTNFIQKFSSRQVLRQVNASAAQLDDRACLRRYMDWVEREIPRSKRIANAWALGDIDALRNAGRSVGDWPACRQVIAQAFGHTLSIQAAEAEAENRWLAAAEAAIARNTSTFATLPMHQVTSSNGLLARLKARGYEVQAPTSPVPSEADSP
ncbi:TraB/GumN family protein [Lysobacteraceae bacterium NML71-0210]|nr:TraB/GumN family protein [Xanthomonadaceae bacterium NML71-0210]